MKESILLSELQNYLAYGLKVENITGEKFIIIGTYIDTNSLICSSGKYSKIELSISNLKPLVRPLSELFTPSIDGLSHLTIIAHEYFGFGKGYVQEPEFNIIQENGFCGYQSKNQCVFFVRQDTFYGDSTYFTHQQKGDGLWITQKVTNQLEMFQYLFKNNFDVFNWLERGLAISLTYSFKNQAEPGDPFYR